MYIYINNRNRLRLIIQKRETASSWVHADEALGSFPTQNWRIGHGMSCPVPSISKDMDDMDFATAVSLHAQETLHSCVV